MECRYLEATEAAHGEWDAYVMQSPHAHHYHLSGWGRLVERVYRHRAVYWLAEHGNRTHGILPLIEMKSWVQGHVLTSLPFLDYGGICADDMTTRKALLDAAISQCQEVQAQTLDLRHYDSSELGLSGFSDKVTLVLPLGKTPDDMWRGFNAKVRNQIRKATKSDLTVGWAGVEALPAFYRVWAENMRELASPAHSIRFFRAIFEEFDRVRLVLVSLRDQIIGGGLCLYFRDTVLMPWASSLRSFFRYCPNNLLYWEAIRAACEDGYQTFDFGRSSQNSGTYHFKRQWGAAEHELGWEYWSGEGTARLMVQAESSRYRAAMSLWRKLPLSVTIGLGPFLRRHLSN